MVKLCIPQLGYSLILGLGSVTFGYVIAYPSPAVPQLKKHFQYKELYLTFFNAVSALFGMIGPFATRLFISPDLPLGRRTSVFVISCAGVLFWTLVLLTGYSIWLGIVARAGLGVVMGAFSAIVPLYIIELSPPAATGFFGSFPQLLTSSGVTLVYLVGAWADWNVNAIVGACICAALCLLVWIVPESPEVLSPTSLRDAPAAESVCQSRYISSLVISCALMFFQQFTGVSGIVSNLDQIFKNAQVPESIQRYASAISGFAQVLGCLIAGSLIQAFGRKINWIISLAGIAITDLIYALYQNPNLTHKFPKWVPILVIFINMLGFGIGAGPIPWFVIPEMFPPDVRPAANSIGFCSNWVFTFTVIVTFPSLSKATGDWGVFLLFAIISFVGVVFGFFCVKDPVIGHMLEDSLGTAIYDGGDTE